MNIGSLFSGSGMLDEGVRAVLGGEVAWHAEVEPAASRVLAHRYPDVPNLGDITAVDWAAVEPVDVITGGSPCQDVSHAGKRAGMRAGTRSGLWSRMCDAIETIRPGLVVWENVRGVLSAEADSAMEPCPGCVGDGDDGPVLRALGRVLGDLAELGYDASWHGLRAADVGAPHGRFRVFIFATDAQRVGRDGWAHDARRGTLRGTAAAGASALVAADAGGEAGEFGTGLCASGPGREWRGRSGDVDGPAAADTYGAGSQGRESAAGRHLPDRCPAADSASDGRDEGRTESAGIVGGSDAAERSAVAAYADDNAAGNGRESGHSRGRRPEPAQCGSRTPANPDRDALRQQPVTEPGRSGQTIAGLPVQWGQYEPAIRRWEAILGRPAPAPTEPGPRGGQRLSPRLTEWMMGWPEGWVTDVPGISRNDALRICGNGVVPQQAAEALRRMLTASAECAA